MRHSFLPLVLSSRIRSSHSFPTKRHYFQRCSIGISGPTSSVTSSPTTNVVGSTKVFSSTPIQQVLDASVSTSNAFDNKYTTFDSYRNSGGIVVPSEQRPPVRPYPVTSKKYIPRSKGIIKPPYADLGIIPPSKYHNTILIHDDPKDVDRMRVAARLARKVLDYACTLAKPGVTTDEIDTAVHDRLIEEGAYPSPLNYHHFPKSLCSSINEVICHGIPDTRPLQDGDIVSFDVSCYINGVHGDNCATMIVGDEQDTDTVGVDWRGVPYRGSDKFSTPEEEAMVRAGRRLVHATRESMYAAIERIKRPGSCLTDVGAAIQDVADSYGYSTVEKYRGHGIGEEFHCPPFVKHFRNNDRLKLVPGMIFTIEPMLVEGAGECFEWNDQWTVATVDGSMAAQFEHTVLITDDGVEILTLPDNE